MSPTKTSWPPKLDAKIQFCCFSVMALVFVPLYLLFPETISVTGIVCELLFAGAACFYGYQIFFHSEEWFRMKQENGALEEQQWRAKHPLLYYLLTLALPFLLVGFLLVKEFLAHLHKH